MGLRAHPQYVEVPNRFKSWTPVAYETDHPKEVIETENYFLPARHMLEAGDEIRVTCMRDDATWDRAKFEVVYKGDRTLTVERITPWRHGGVVVLRGLKAVHAGWGKWRVEDSAGKEIAKGLTKDEALVWIERRNPPDAPLSEMIEESAA